MSFQRYYYVYCNIINCYYCYHSDIDYNYYYLYCYGDLKYYRIGDVCLLLLLNVNYGI